MDTDTSSGPTYSLLAGEHCGCQFHAEPYGCHHEPHLEPQRAVFGEAVKFEFHPCICPASECPNITDNGGECLACKTGHHEAEE